MTDGGGVVTSELMPERDWQRRDATEFARESGVVRQVWMKLATAREYSLTYPPCYVFFHRRDDWLWSIKKTLDYVNLGGLIASV